MIVCNYVSLKSKSVLCDSWYKVNMQNSIQHVSVNQNSYGFPLYKYNFYTENSEVTRMMVINCVHSRLILY